jgi:hypothetical protein
MVRRELWAEIRRLRGREGLLASELTGRFDLDRNTVRRCLN